MRIRALLENTSLDDAFQTEHGLSLYIETQRHCLLFDVAPAIFSSKTPGRWVSTSPARIRSLFPTATVITAADCPRFCVRTPRPLSMSVKRLLSALRPPARRFDA